MKAQNKIPSEIIIDRDLDSERIAELIKENVNKLNQYLEKLEKVRKVKISDAEIFELIKGKTTTGTIAKNYYKEFPPELMEISQSGLDYALQELNPIIIFFRGNVTHNIDRYRFEFIEVQDYRLTAKTNMLEELNEIFTLKIVGVNVEHYLEAQRICEDLQELMNKTGMYFHEIFDAGLYGDKISVYEKVFADYSKRNVR